MIDALRIIWFSLKDLWEEFVLLVALNLLWALTVALPVTPFFLLQGGDPIWRLAASLLLAIPLPIVSGALCFVANQIARGKFVGWGTFWTGLRRYWAKSLIVALINLVVLILLATNLQFYGAVLEGMWTNFALSAWLVVGIYWLLVQIFWFPMLLELEDEQILVALRNALAMVIITPGFTLSLGTAILVLSVLGVVLTVPALLFMASLLLLICNHATRSRLARVQKKPYLPGMDED
jgi:hypothetical protein